MGEIKEITKAANSLQVTAHNGKKMKDKGLKFNCEMSAVNFDLILKRLLAVPNTPMAVE